jgi:pyruvate-formate lyase-activating enzyme
MPLDKRRLYRLPWSMNDNPIAWLEVTDVCNLHCEGCYRQHLEGHKPLEQIREEILFFKQWRNPDNVSIAGGEPLVHPQILDIVALIRQNGLKPIVLTNALALTPGLVAELKRAGCAGFTIHIDSRQERPLWQGKNEGELNELRATYADMVARVGGMSVVFNSTVYPETYDQIPDVVRWGLAHIDRVHGLVFITYRVATPDIAAAVGPTAQAVDLERLSYARERFSGEFVTSPQVYQAIKDTVPAYEPCCYLGGTLVHSSYKWLIGALIGSRHGVYGSLGKRGMELAQAGHHWFVGSYLAYLSSPGVGGAAFLFWPWDRAVRRALGQRLKEIIRRPWRLFSPVHMQTIAIIQAPDLQPSGVADMCDGCPDMTVWEGRLVNSCRMDEYRLFGGLVTVTDRSARG